MPIRPSPAPDAVITALRSCLLDRKRGIRAAGLAGPLGMTAPLPRYILPERVVPVRRELRLFSWDAFVVADNDVALASLQVRDDALVFGGLISGMLAKRALDAAEFAATRLEASRLTYRPYFLESGPAGHFSLVFAPRRGAAKYVSIVEGSIVPSTAIRIKTGLSQLLRRIADEGVRRSTVDMF